MLLILWTVVLVGMMGIVAFSNWRMQQAWRWWVHQEAQHRVVWADQIQNGLLQDLFALRLNLQPLSPDSGSTDDSMARLAAEKLHHRLDDLSTALLSPYLPHSLPLALRARLQQWQTAHACDLQLNLPVSWPQEPLEQSQILLATLERLLEFTAVLPSLTALTVDLIQQTEQARLTIELSYELLPKTSWHTTYAKELEYLCRCFQVLMPGWCHYRIGTQTITWQFSWKLIPVDGD